MKKKLINIIGSVFFLLTVLTGCTDQTDNGQLKIVTTIFPQYDFAKHIAGENASVTMLITPGSESHTYEPTPSDIAKIQQADLFIYNGGESEVWVDEILESVGKEDLNTLRLMDYVDLTEEDEAEYESSDEHEHDHEYDEHIFTSLKNSEILLNTICDELCSIDDKNKNTYTENTENYCNEISELDAMFTDMINSAERKTVVFGDRFPFRYFADDYGLECYAAFSGCSSETEASSATVSELIKIVKNENIPIVFYIEFSNQKTAEKIAQACSVKTGLLHSCHNISKEDLDNNVSYVDIMKSNYNILSEALN
ncbi:MAG: metal ABC transporter substrate-binding protein [Porcipelethomonas sp.]